jgi:hypothetical protein
VGDGGLMVWTLKPLKYYEVVEVDNKNIEVCT